MKTTNEVRKYFLDYFKKEGHEIVPSSPLIPHNDPTLMFTAAGMVQFKNVFTGQEKRDYKTATSSQKCVRAGGKHNDLENVGYTTRHHTFFEMLGNFSFGDYFKERAIELAWNLVTKDFGLAKDRLLVTVYHTDDEAFNIWKKISGFSDDKIIRIATKDNFWSAGDTGPCGPSTEIFYDNGKHIQGGPPGTAEEDGDRFVEIWNLVFMQYDQISKDERINLPNPSIDTGMGLERISTILQGSYDNYDIDIFRNIINLSASLTNSEPNGEFKISHRVIADHLRASAFLIADGVLPSNEGRGYVLRRIMRRGMRHAHILGAKEPLMYKLLPSLTETMGDAYPELHRADALISETLKLEEMRFKQTLDKGLALLEAETAKLDANTPLSGEVAFKLYDTYGFPLDLTEDVLRREQNREVDTEGFNKAMAGQKETARKAWKGSGEAATEELWFEIKDKFGTTEFVGYNILETEGKILAIIDENGDIVDKISESNIAYIVTNQTPFYAESGGQVGDTGEIFDNDGNHAKVLDVQKKLGAVFVHKIKQISGEFKTDMNVYMALDNNRRQDIKCNHSATHLLNAALRCNLGEHIAQKGSLVDAEKLRFDISHPKALTEDEIKKIELDVNKKIRQNTKTSTKIMPLDDARKAGAVAMFGEKYDSEVRVVSIGESGEEQMPYSMELCGGTHVERTGEIGVFKIISESAVSAGVRRIEAVTGRAAFEYLSNQSKLVKLTAEKLKTSEDELTNRIDSLIADKKKLEKEVTNIRRKLATVGDVAQEGANDSNVKNINGIPFAARVINDIPPKELKPMADEMKKQLGSAVITLIAVNDGKASLVVGVTDDLTEKVNAVDLVRIGAEKLGGKGGGGRPDMAQAGGPDASLASDAIDAIQTAL